MTISSKESMNTFANTFNITPGKNPTCDPATQQRLRDLHTSLRSSRVRPATVLNMHPFVLRLNDALLRGLEIPACPPGEPYKKHVIRQWRLDYGNVQEDGSVIPGSIMPIQQAQQFIREYAHMGGVVVYEGEDHPDKLTQIPIFNSEGASILTVLKVDGQEVEEPVLEPFEKVFFEAKSQRDSVYEAAVNQARSSWADPTGARRREVDDVHRAMADVLYRNGRLAEKVEFAIESREEAGLSEAVCPACGVRFQKDAALCTACHLYVVDPLKAYKHNLIDYTHLSMDRLNEKEWAEANKIKAQRDKNKPKAN